MGFIQNDDRILLELVVEQTLTEQATISQIPVFHTIPTSVSPVTSRLAFGLSCSAAKICYVQCKILWFRKAFSTYETNQALAYTCLLPLPLMNQNGWQFLSPRRKKEYFMQVLPEVRSSNLMEYPTSSPNWTPISYATRLRRRRHQIHPCTGLKSTEWQKELMELNPSISKNPRCQHKNCPRWPIYKPIALSSGISSGVSNQSSNQDTSWDLMKKKDEGVNWILKKDCILLRADKF